MPPAVKSSMLPNIDILGSVIWDYLAMQMPGILLCGLVDMSAIDPQVTTLPICVSFFTMIHLARVIPPSLSKAALKCLMRRWGNLHYWNTRWCLEPSTAWSKVWRSGSSSVSQHAASAFISSLVSSGFGCSEDNHLVQAIRMYNSQVSTSNAITVIESRITQKPRLQILKSIVSYPC